MAPRSLSAALLAFALLAALALGAPASAAAALPWAECRPAGFECARLAVPLDRSGATPGTVSLHATRVRAASNPGAVAVVALAGGPGQAAAPLAADFSQVLAPALTTRDLLVFDQRGTGRSGALDCTSLRSARTVNQLTARCARELGAARGLYTTQQTVEDIESLRVAAGYEKLVLHGVSYGTKVALAYASAHPDRVESLVLDSVVLPEGPDAFQRSSLVASSRAVEELCAGGACSAATPAAARDLARLAERLRRGSLSGPIFSATGRRFTARLTEPGLAGILLAGDLNPALRAELPGSIRAALSGDVKPILRLSARSAGLENAAQPAAPAPGAGAGAGGGGGAPGLQSARADSDALYFATLCEENPTFPWTRGAPLSQKRREARAAAQALPEGSTGPFSRAAALASGFASLCLGWPTASPIPAAPAPLPAVPTLLLEGRQDLRTPVEDAAALAARIPGAQLVAVPNVGHSVLGSDPSSCARDAVAAFFAGQPVAQCAATPPRFAPTAKPATRLDRLPAYRGTSGRAGRTLEALRRTVNDGRSSVLGEALAIGRSPSGVGGLRGGYLRVTGRGTLVFRGYEYVPGVTVSGSLPPEGTATLQVRGSAAARGTVRITASLRVSGTLGGRRVSAQFGTAASADGGLGPRISVRQAAAQGRLVAGGR
jgi:pimeloyl-ACP methyl ester carboxylesterase